MSLSDNKITNSEKNSVSVKSVQGSRLKGTVQENKNVFDKLGELLASKLNGLIDAIESSDDGASGAASMGVTGITGFDGDNVQTVLENIASAVLARYTKTESDTLLELKEDKSTTAKLIKSVSFDGDNGKFTFTYLDGTTTVIDTALEKVVANFSYSKNTQSLILTLADGSTQSIDLSDFITETEFLDSDTIDFSVNSHVATASIKPGSITDSMLSSALIAALTGYVTSASSSAESASGSSTAAANSANSAAASASSALESAETAELRKVAAEEAKTDAEAAMDESVAAKNDAVAAKIAAEAARDEAKSVVGGDYATKEDLNAHAGDVSVHVTAEEKREWNDSDVFIATYGKTTSAEIEAAYQARKAVYVKSGPILGELKRRNSATVHFFHILSNDTYRSIVCASDEWSVDLYNYTPASHASTHASGGSDPITPESIGAATKQDVDTKQNAPTYVATTLLASNWEQYSGYYMYDFESIYPHSSYDIEIEPNADNTKASMEAWSSAMIVASKCEGIQKNQIIAIGDVPTLNIYINIKVVEK